MSIIVWSATSSMKTSGTFVTGIPPLCGRGHVDPVGSDAAQRDHPTPLQAIDDTRRNAAAARDQGIGITGAVDELLLAFRGYLKYARAYRSQGLCLEKLCPAGKLVGY